MAGFGFGTANGSGAGTEFLTMLPPPKDDLNGYNNSLSHSDAKQPGTIPQTFHDAMSVREEVYGEQGVSLEAEFDEDDPRSWHWVVYASVASTATSPPKDLRTDSPANRSDDARRSSATASRLAVGTIRLIPPSHKAHSRSEEGDKHPDADPPPSLGHDTKVEKKHPAEPFVKLGRLAVLAPYRKFGLAKLLINTAMDYASKHPELIYQPPSPTTLELANLKGSSAADAATWRGLIMVHAQASLVPLWQKYGFAEQLIDEQGEVEISKEEHWMEEGIEHVGMWKRMKIESSRL